MSATTNLAWAEDLKQRLGAKLLAVRESAPGELEFTVGPADAHMLLSELKNLDGGGFDHLADLTGYDEHPKSPRFYVIYELISMLKKLRCAVVVPCADDLSPSVPTICDLWAGANWLERETFDLLGIVFSEHADLRRILLPSSFQGHPLRKDFIADYRQHFPKPSKDSQIFDPFKNTIVEITKES